jgi:TusA-related sulfurtransferase
LDELMQKMGRDEIVHLLTDNKLADTDVPSWVSLKGHKILERRKGSLIHFITGRRQ